MKRNYDAFNKSAVIRHRKDRKQKDRTETYGREWGTLNAAISTDPTSHATALHIDLPDGESLHFAGNEARTLYRLMQKHYRNIGRAW
jgi:hypothetical protein